MDLQAGKVEKNASDKNPVTVARLWEVRSQTHGKHHSTDPCTWLLRLFSAKGGGWRSQCQHSFGNQIALNKISTILNFRSFYGIPFCMFFFFPPFDCSPSASAAAIDCTSGTKLGLSYRDWVGHVATPDLHWVDPDLACDQKYPCDGTTRPCTLTIIRFIHHVQHRSSCISSAPAKPCHSTGYRSHFS